MGCSNSRSLTPVEAIIAHDFHDKYLLGAKLGCGAFAQVRACTEITYSPLRAMEGTDGPGTKAVKILDLEMKGRSNKISAQLRVIAHEEVAVWRIIGDHPNCIRLYDSFFNEEFAFMVMEECDSELLPTLESVIELNEHGLRDVLVQMLLGITHCHRSGIVHRDVKPDNFLVERSSQTVKLGDFGLSAALPKYGKLQGAFGTAPFMCPEMLTGQPYDGKADVWSFAVIAYVLLFGKFPYMPRQQDSKAMRQAIIDGSPPPFRVSFKIPKASRVRSLGAISMTKALLNRGPECRPTSEEALYIPWMQVAMDSTHIGGNELPSLQPMLCSAKRVGAFGRRDIRGSTDTDVKLDAAQVRKYGQGLPLAPPFIVAMPAKRHIRASSRNLRAAPKIGNSPSERSTTDGGSSGVDDISIDFRHGSRIGERPY